MNTADGQAHATIGVDGAGRPTVNCDAVKISLGGLDIELHGSFSAWLLQLFVDVFSGYIKSAVEGAAAGAIKDTVNQQAAQALATIPVREQIGTYSYVDFGLAAAPAVTADTLAMPLNGAFHNQAPYPDPPCPAPHHQLPDSFGPAAMVQVFVDEFIVDSAAQIYYFQNFLGLSVNDSQVPAEVPIRLNTATFEDIMPDLYALYPDTMMQLDAFASQPPLAFFTPDGISGKMPTMLNFSVLPTGKPRVPAFGLKADVSFAGTAECDDGKIFGKVSLLDAPITLGWVAPFMQPFDPMPFGELVKFAISYAAIPYINKFLGQGFAIPVVEGVTFSNEHITMGQGFIAAGMDFDYKP